MWLDVSFPRPGASEKGAGTNARRAQFRMCDDGPEGRRPPFLSFFHTLSIPSTPPPHARSPPPALARTPRSPRLRHPPTSPNHGIPRGRPPAGRPPGQGMRKRRTRGYCLFVRRPGAGQRAWACPFLCTQARGVSAALSTGPHGSAPVRSGRATQMHRFLCAARPPAAPASSLSLESPPFCPRCGPLGPAPPLATLQATAPVLYRCDGGGGVGKTGRPCRSCGTRTEGGRVARRRRVYEAQARRGPSRKRPPGALRHPPPFTPPLARA